MSAIIILLLIIAALLVWFAAKNSRQRDALLQKAEASGKPDDWVDMGAFFYKRGDFAKARHWYAKAAEAGDEFGYLNLGTLYLYGKGVDRDPGIAFQHFLCAAEQNSVVAMFNIGNLYQQDKGFGVNYGKALHWYEKAADYGYAGALYNLGNMHYFGNGTAADKNKAYTYYEKAVLEGTYTDDLKPHLQKFAQKGDMIAQCYFSLLLNKGYANDKTGHSWLVKSARQNFPPALHHMGVLCDAAGQHAEAIDWYRKAAGQDFAPALYNLGIALEYGARIEQDKVLAIEYYQRSAAFEYPYAMAHLGQLYLKGDMVNRDYTKAYELLQKAARQKIGLAQEALGDMYYNGYGVEQDYIQAYVWYKLASVYGSYQEGAPWNFLGIESHLNKDELKPAMVLARQKQYEISRFEVNKNAAALQRRIDKATAGDPEAQCELARLYYFAEFPVVVQDYAKAFEWFTKAAGQGYAEAQYRLGLMYRDGDKGVVERDLDTAVQWLEKALLQKYESAGFSLYFTWYYGGGDEFPPDLEKAYMWLEVFATFVDTDKDKADVAKMRAEITAQMTEEQIRNAENAAGQWLNKYF